MQMVEMDEPTERRDLKGFDAQVGIGAEIEMARNE
jgi:hypothetical protein